MGVKGDRVRVKINALNQQSASTFIEIYAVICVCLHVCGRTGAHSGPGASGAVNCSYLAGSIRTLIGMQVLFFTAARGTR